MEIKIRCNAALWCQAAPTLVSLIYIEESEILPHN